MVKRKVRPKALTEGKEWINKLKNMAVSKTTIAMADRTSDF